MAWTSPMTAVAGDPFTAAQFNTHVRDNLLATGPAVATGPGGILATTGANAITQRTPSNSFVGDSNSTTDTGWVDLAAHGPEVTVQTGPFAFVFLTTRLSHGSGGSGGGENRMSFEVTGASSIVAASGRALIMRPASPSQEMRLSVLVFLHNLTPGLNTFTAKYSSRNGTAYFSQRELSVFPF